MDKSRNQQYCERIVEGYGWSSVATFRRNAPSYSIYSIAIEEFGLQFKPYKLKDNLHEMIGYSDCDYDKDKETRRSVSGYSLFLNGLLVQWKSKMQEVVSLSVTEAELIDAT
jgi:hypothetical protein